jgi:hypothetical protein
VSNDRPRFVDPELNIKYYPLGGSIEQKIDLGDKVSIAISMFDDPELEIWVYANGQDSLEYDYCLETMHI